MGVPLFLRSAPAFRVIVVFSLILVFPLLGLDDEARKESFRSLVSQKEALIPQDLRDWINHQVIQLDRFDKTHAHLDKEKILKVLRKAENSLKESESSQNDQTKKYSNVLSDNFDWKEFALYVVDVIHKSSYRRKEVIDNAIG